MKGEDVNKDMISDSEILCIVTTHKIDILKLLSEADYDPYRLSKELGITYKTCYETLKALEKAGLIGGRFKYHITNRAREILSSLKESASND